MTSRSSPAHPFSFVLIGAGRVGTAVATLLARAGNKVMGVGSRTQVSAQAGARRLDTETVELPAIPQCDVVLLGLPEKAIAPVCADIAENLRDGTVVWHLTGSFGIDPLRSVLDGGARGCALHPVQACPDVDTAIARLPGSAWGMTTSSGVEAWADEVIVTDLEGIAVPVAEENRPLWHAAAVTVSNGSAALLAAGENMLESIGITHPERVLGPLAAGTIANAVEGGGGSPTLTGPVVRGEVDAVARHLDALGARSNALAVAYARAAQLVLDQARRGGRIDDAAARRLEKLLESYR